MKSLAFGLLCVITSLGLGTGCDDMLLITPEVQSEKEVLSGFNSTMTICDLDWVRRHLEAYPGILKTGKWIRHPLYQATAMNHVELAQILLDAGADPNQMSAIGNPPLHEAASSDSAEMIELLVRFGADVEKRDEISKQSGGKGRTAMYLAVQDGRAKAVRALIKAGAKFEIEAEPSALHLAVSGRYVRKPERLHARFTPDGKSVESKVQPCVPGNTEVIDALIEAGARTDALYFNSDILTWAIRHYDLETIRHLLTKHKDRFRINERNANGDRPLTLAIRGPVALSDSWADQKGVIEFLLQCGADTSLVPEYEDYASQLKKK